MSPVNDITRDLLPPIAANPQDIPGPEMPFAGSVVSASEAPPPSYPASGADSLLPRNKQGDAPHEHDFDGNFVTVPFKDLPSFNEAPRFSATLVKDPEANHFAPITVVYHASLPKPATINDHKGAGSHDPEGGRARSDEPDSDDVRGGFSGNPNDSPGGLAGTDAHAIGVRQIAIVDQDASILVNGFVGEVVARVQIDQDLLMDQDVDIDFTIDGDGHFNLLLDQDVRIDQDVQIDLKIFDVDGILYIDLFVHDAVEVEQDTTVEMQISDGPVGGTIEINQDVEITQDVDIDIEIEDDLEERYIVKVQVETLQQADVDQDVIVDVKEWNGQIEMDVDATQTASIDQQTIVQADFALV